MRANKHLTQQLTTSRKILQHLQLVMKKPLKTLQAHHLNLDLMKVDYMFVSQNSKLF